MLRRSRYCHKVFSTWAAALTTFSDDLWGKELCLVYKHTIHAAEIESLYAGTLESRLKLSPLHRMNNPDSMIKMNYDNLHQMCCRRQHGKGTHTWMKSGTVSGSGSPHLPNEMETKPGHKTQLCYYLSPASPISSLTSDQHYHSWWCWTATGWRGTQTQILMHRNIFALGWLCLQPG